MRKEIIESGKNESIANYHDKANLKLLEEQLNITKEWVKTGDVSIRKEVFIEEKSITVPILREELVIEKKDACKNTNPEIIRIPIKKENVEVVKHPVVLEDVSIYKRRFKKIETVEDTLKKEKLKIETIGDAKVIDHNKQL